MSTAYLSLGSNIGDGIQNIETAIQHIQNNTELIASSSFYRTEPQGTKHVPWYYNAVIAVSVSFTPFELLQYTMDIETTLGRQRSETLHEPRTIDIDILLYDSVLVDNESLVIPHPRMCERAFVLIPLAEIAPTILIHGKTPKDYLSLLSYTVEGNILLQE